MIRSVPFLAAAILLASPAVSQERDDLEKLVGKWALDTGGYYARGEPAPIGYQIKIEPSFVGWEIWLEERGRGALVLDTTGGANIRVSTSTKEVVTDCFYSVGLPDGGNRLLWTLRKGPPKDCPPSGSYVHLDSGKTRAQEIAEAVAFRRRLTAKVSAGPVDMQGIEVIYFSRPADGETVRTALDGAGIGFTQRTSNTPLPSNVITCQKKVPIEATKNLARHLIEAGVPIRVIRPTENQQFNKRLTVESLGQWVPKRPLITLAQVDAMTTCNVGNTDGAKLAEPVSAKPAKAPPAPPPQVAVRNDPPPAPAPPPRVQAPESRPKPAPGKESGGSFMFSDSVDKAAPEGPPIPEVGDSKVRIRFSTKDCADPYNVTVRYWSPAKESWQMSHLKAVEEDKETFKNEDGTDVTTSTKEVYFYIRNANTGAVAKLTGKPVGGFPNSTVSYYKSRPDMTMTCGGGT